MPLRPIVTVLIFLATMCCVVRRPRQWPEAVWTCLGAAALLALGLVTPYDASAIIHAASDALLFLGALLLLSALLECSGFFDWAAIEAARLAAGRVRTLYRNLFILGAVITAILSLDTTAVILTPIVLAIVRRLNLPARPFIFACAFVANSASLPLPASNLTNLLFASAFHLRFAGFAARMLLPAIAAVAVNYWLFCRIFRRELLGGFNVTKLPSSGTVVPHRGYFRWSVGVLAAVCVGYFLAPLFHVEPYVIGFLGCAALLVAGVHSRRVSVRVLRHVPWSVFPFVIGLFIIVQGIESLGVGHAAATLIGELPPDGIWAAPVAALLAALASNLVNNLPAALLARNVLQAAHASAASVPGALLGTNIGPNIVVIGSLATMLVLTRARADGDAPSNADVLRVGLRVTPLVLGAAILALELTFWMHRG